MNSARRDCKIVLPLLVELTMSRLHAPLRIGGFRHEVGFFFGGPSTVMHAIRNGLLFCFVVLGATSLDAATPTKASKENLPATIHLWQGKAPGALGQRPEDVPELTPFIVPADKANGTAVIVLPGGGYQHLAMTYEGYDAARWLNTLGVSAFVLKYRLASAGYHHPIFLGDASRAVRLVRSKAAKWHIDPKRIGMLGFSAGGHLSTTLATHFDKGNAQAKDPVDRVSSRPDFLVLCYPSVTLKQFAYMPARPALFGNKPTEAQLNSLSNELHVTAETPPTFLFHTAADKGVLVENSVLFFSALRKAGVPAELHIFQEGVHGAGLGKGDPALTKWPLLCEQWMIKNKLLPATVATK